MDNRTPEIRPGDLSTPDADQRRRIQKLKEELQELARGKAEFGGMPDVPPDIEEQFLKQVLEFEKAPRDTDFNRLIQRGIDLPAPDALTDAQITMKLWE